MQREILAVGQRTTAHDLAQALDENEGTFLCQQAGQSYIAVSRRGHSIISLRPVGRRFVEVTGTTGSQEPWSVEKISNEELGTTGSGGGEQQQYAGAGNRQSRTA